MHTTMDMLHKTNLCRINSLDCRYHLQTQTPCRYLRTSYLIVNVDIGASETMYAEWDKGPGCSKR